LVFEDVSAAPAPGPTVAQDANRIPVLASWRVYPTLKEMSTFPVTSARRVNEKEEWGRVEKIRKTIPAPGINLMEV